MVKSLFVTASAGSGKTFRLTQEVLSHLKHGRGFIVAATFTRAAAAEMEKRILEEIEEGIDPPPEKLRLMVLASKVRFSTIDALFHHFLTTEAYTPQVADGHEQELIAAAADQRFFQHPRIIEDVEAVLIAARTLHLPPESLIEALERGRRALAFWECPDKLLEQLKEKQARMVGEYEQFQKQVQAVAEATAGNLARMVVGPLLQPIGEVDLGKALFGKSDLSEVKIAAADRGTPAYHLLREIYPTMRRLIAEHLINTRRLRSALLKGFSTLRDALLAEEKKRLGRLYFDDIPKELMALDGPESHDRPRLQARLYELGFHRTKHLLLDEFQDTSKVQFDLLRPLLEEILSGVGEDAEGEGSLFLVGDWKQSIYQWRDAAPDHLRASIDPALQTGQIASETLPHNYRSTPLLIHFFNHLVAELFAGTDQVHLQTPPQKRKQPYSGNSQVAAIPVACEGGDGPAYERLVVGIAQMRAEYGCALGDIAVLCRSNGHLEKVAAALAQAGIPTSGIRGRELLSLREGTALFLSLIALFGPPDERFVPRAFSALGYGETLNHAVKRLAEKVREAPQPHRFASLAAALSDLHPHFPRVVMETLWNEAERYFDRPDTSDAMEFLRYLKEVSHLITIPEGEHADRVKLATIHSTKGLQFPHVFLFWKEEAEQPPEILYPADGAPLVFNKDEITFLTTGPIPEAADIASGARAAREEEDSATANLLYVAATRAVNTLTFILRADKGGNLKGFGERIFRTTHREIPDAGRTESGWRQDYGPEKPKPSGHEELTMPDLSALALAPVEQEPLDPVLYSAAIETGIERGLRIHAALARLTHGQRTISPEELTQEETTAINRFLGEERVREILYRPGTTHTEQHLSDTRSFGIVDRLIIAPELITLIDFKTGRVAHLADKYRPQMIRYRNILRELFGERRIECFLLFVDEPKRVTAV